MSCQQDQPWVTRGGRTPNGLPHTGRTLQTCLEHKHCYCHADIGTFLVVLPCCSWYSLKELDRMFKVRRVNVSTAQHSAAQHSRLTLSSNGCHM
jgi:hypothetical protein